VSKILSKVSNSIMKEKKPVILVFFSKMKGQVENPLKVNVKDVCATFISVTITLLLLLTLTAYTSTPWLNAPFGASCLLAFGVWNSPFSQPRNIIGGHLLTSLVGLTIYHLFGNEEWTIALAVGLAIALMMITKTTHPPATGNPIIVILGAHSWSFLFSPILIGTVVIVIMALIVNNLQRDRVYPIFWI